MKYNLILVFCLTTSLFSSINAGPRTGAWAYILHTSHLTDNYLETTIPAYSAISITGFRLAADGSLKFEQNRLIKHIIGLTRRHSISLYPLVSFTSPEGGKRLLNSKNARARAIRLITELIREYKFAGIHLDFEYLSPENSKKLGNFLSELQASPFKGKITMAVFPQIDFPEKWSGFHDLAIIGKFADEIVIMCYDLHNQHTEPGPVTDTEWAEKNIRAALNHIKADRLWLGIPAYGYRWCGGRSDVISAKEAASSARAYLPERHRSQNIYYSYRRADHECRVFASDRHTRESLIELATKYGLAGTAVWRLGLED
jgi:spore germination protein YaaH